jgi:hypothetical protein
MSRPLRNSSPLAVRLPSLGAPSIEILILSLRAESASMSIADIHFHMPLSDEQKGPFYSTDSPIRIVQVRHVGTIPVDPFAL